MLLLSRAALVSILAVLFAGGVAVAHGKPALRVEPSVVGAGGTITCIGSDMEPDTEWSVSLERAAHTVALGTAVAKGAEGEAGFTATFTVPAGTAPGSYTVRAQAKDGTSAAADLTVTEQSASATAGGATTREASGELHQLDRSKPVGEWAVALAVAAALAAGGAWLVRAGE